MSVVLLIEPDKVLSQTIKDALIAKSFDVIVKRNGQIGLDAVDDKTPDCIVLEIQLGLHNGLEFLYELRSYSDWADIPVIVHSNNRNILVHKYKSNWKKLNVSQVLYKSQTTLSDLVRAVGSTMAVK